MPRYYLAYYNTNGSQNTAATVWGRTRCMGRWAHLPAVPERATICGQISLWPVEESIWRHRMGSIKMGIGLGLWHHGMPDAATLLEYIDKAEAWGIDSVWLSDHLMGPRPEVAVMPMMAAIAARTRRLKFGPSVMMLPLRH